VQCSGDFESRLPFPATRVAESSWLVAAEPGPRKALGGVPFAGPLGAPSRHLQSPRPGPCDPGARTRTPRVPHARRAAPRPPATPRHPATRAVTRARTCAPGQIRASPPAPSPPHSPPLPTGRDLPAPRARTPSPVARSPSQRPGAPRPCPQRQVSRLPASLLTGSRRAPNPGPAHGQLPLRPLRAAAPGTGDLGPGTRRCPPPAARSDPGRSPPSAPPPAPSSAARRPLAAACGSAEREGRGVEPREPRRAALSPPASPLHPGLKVKARCPARVLRTLHRVDEVSLSNAYCPPEPGCRRTLSRSCPLSQTALARPAPGTLRPGSPFP
jgi:hypothetical protein